MDEHARVPWLARGIPQQRTRHAQMLGEEDVVLETPKQILAAPREAFDAPALERRRKLRGRQRVRPALVPDLRSNQTAALDKRGELAPDRLNLGELGHPPLSLGRQVPPEPPEQRARREPTAHPAPRE